MATPIEMIRGGERQTVYSEVKAVAAEAEGWQRVANLTPQQQAELATRPAAPWRGYDDMTIEQVLRNAAAFPTERFGDILAYEQATKNRKGVLEAFAGNATLDQARTLRSQMAARGVVTNSVDTLAEVRDEQPPVTVETVAEKPLQTTETVQIVDSGQATKAS